MTRRSNLACFSAVVLLATGNVAAQARDPLTHEVLWAMPRLSSPVVSPDGQWVVFTVQEPSYDTEQEVTDLWLVPTDGSAAPRRLTGGKRAESDVAWSPDSRRLAFVTKRDEDEQSQVYVLDLAAGEAQRLTKAPLGASHPAWSPDGRTMLFESRGYPGAVGEEANRTAADQRKERKTSLLAYESFPIRRWDTWRDDTGPRIYTIPVVGEGETTDLIGRSAMVAENGFQGSWSGRSSDSLEAVWAPGGGSILFVATKAGDAAVRQTVQAQLFEVPAGGGEPGALTTADREVGRPVFSPAGETICYPSNIDRGTIYALNDLECAPWPWGATRVVTAAFDRSVDDFTFSADGSTLYFTAGDAGHVRIFSVPAAGGEVRLVGDSPSGVYAGLGAASPSGLIGLWGSANRPAEVVRVDPSTGERRWLTAFNTAPAASLDWPELREHWFTNRRGQRIHSYLALPPGFDESQRYPLLLLIHGGHASMWQDSISLRWNYHLLAQPGLVILATDYRGSTGYGEAFTLDILGNPLRGPAEDLEEAADQALSDFPFLDRTRQAAAGASYGGHLANWLAATSDRFRCLISHAGLASLEMQWGLSDSIFHREVMMGVPYWEDPAAWIEQSPLAHAGGMKTPMLMSVGANDFRVPLGNTLAIWAALQRQQVPSRLLVWPDENHWILQAENSRTFYEEVRGWLERWLLPAEALTSTVPR